MKRIRSYTEDLFAFDSGYDSYEHICGVDEAGRGPIAGPVVAAAVIMPRGIYIKEVNDSKQLSDKRRRRLADAILDNAVAVGFGVIDNHGIDEMNILRASLAAMKKAVTALLVTPDIVLVDGINEIDTPLQQRIVKHGDARSFAIACASILAKVKRDNMMIEFAEQYPVYEFAKHKGYPSKVHKERLREFGACPIHRRSFAPVKAVLESGIDYGG